MKVGGRTLCLNSPDKTEWYCEEKFVELLCCSLIFPDTTNWPVTFPELLMTFKLMKSLHQVLPSR